MEPKDHPVKGSRTPGNRGSKMNGKLLKSFTLERLKVGNQRSAKIAKVRVFRGMNSCGDSWRYSRQSAVHLRLGPSITSLFQRLRGECSRKELRDAGNDPIPLNIRQNHREVAKLDQNLPAGAAR